MLIYFYGSYSILNLTYENLNSLQVISFNLADKIKLMTLANDSSTMAILTNLNSGGIEQYQLVSNCSDYQAVENGSFCTCYRYTGAYCDLLISNSTNSTTNSSNTNSTTNSTNNTNSNNSTNISNTTNNTNTNSGSNSTNSNNNTNINNNTNSTNTDTASQLAAVSGAGSSSSSFSTTYIIIAAVGAVALSIDVSI